MIRRCVLQNIQSHLVHLPFLTIFCDNRNIPAPLDLCFVSGFDLKDDTALCPLERNALKEFFDSTKGGEWTDNANWKDPIKSICSWYGVKCDDNNTHAVELNLTNNGLSGSLSESIGRLSSLEILDLSDNDIKGSLPTEIGSLSKLTYLRLSYNAFIGTAPTELENLTQLELIQMHGNRIGGTIPIIDLASKELYGDSSFVADCGNPSDFDESLNCDECTMCCEYYYQIIIYIYVNISLHLKARILLSLTLLGFLSGNAQGDCYRNEDNFENVGFIGNYQQFTGLFFLCLFIACCAAALTLYIKDKYENRALPTSSIRRPSVSIRDQIYAWNVIGDDSVYQFMLGKSWMGWAIALVTMGLQIWMLFVFVKVSRHLSQLLLSYFSSNSPDSSHSNLFHKGCRN